MIDDLRPYLSSYLVTWLLVPTSVGYTFVQPLAHWRICAGRTPRIFLKAMHLPVAFATAFDTCSFMDSPESSVTPKILTVRFGAIVLSPNTEWFDGPRSGCSGRTKWMKPVFSASNTAPLSRAHFSALGSSSVCSLRVFSAAFGPVTHAF